MRIIVALLMIISFSLSFAKKEEAMPTWNEQMKTLSKALGDILPDLFKPDPKTPEEIATLKKKSKTLYQASQNIDLTHQHGTKAPDADPTLVFISGMFRDEIENAHKGIEQGFYGYSKDRLKASVSYCIACHTRDASGPRFPLLDAFQEPLKQAPWIDRVKFEVALRKFDSAYTDVMQKIEDPTILKSYRIGLEPVINIALSIAVRVKNSPEQALLICKKILASDTPNTSLKDKAMVWEKDIRQWQKETSQKFTTDKQLIDKAKQLIGLDSKKPYERSFSGEVRYLRATELMHTLLKEHPKSEYTPEALYIIGLSYEVINEMTFWGLQEKYFERCVDLRPHSAIAESCFKSYRDSVELGYSGSSGLNVPEHVASKIKKLGELAKVTK